jgi:hypothetical protein
MKSVTYFGGSTLDYASYDFEKTGYAPVPPPSLNGGLFTGEKFIAGAPWGNIPVSPETDVYIHTNLKSAHPPPGANVHYPHQTRPGNNLQRMPGIGLYKKDTHFIQCPRNPPQKKCECYDECSCQKCYFRK